MELFLTFMFVLCLSTGPPLELPLALWDKVGQYATDTHMRAANTFFRNVSDSSTAPFTAQLRMSQPNLHIPIAAAQDFDSLDNFMSHRTRLSTLNLLISMPDEIQPAVRAEMEQQVIQFKNVLHTRAPNTTKILLQHEGARHPQDALLFKIFLTPFAANLTSLKLEINSRFFTHANFVPFLRLQKLDCNRWDWVPDIEFLSALPHVQQLSIRTESTSAAAFGAVPQLQCLALEVHDHSHNRQQEGMVGIQQLAAHLTELTLDYSGTDIMYAHGGHAAPHSDAMVYVSQLLQLFTLNLFWDGPLDISSLSSLVGLDQLHLECECVHNINSTSGMSALRHLHCEQQGIWTPGYLDTTHNSRLRVLSLPNRRMSKQDINTIAATPSLVRLDLNHCTGVAAKHILPFTALTGLTSLRLSNTQVGHFSCRNKSSIRVINYTGHAYVLARFMPFV